MAANLDPDARVLVWMPRWLGDFQMAEPSVAALASYLAAGSGRLSLAMPRAYLELYDEANFQLDDEVGRAHLVAVEDEISFQNTLRASDVVVLLRGSFRSAWKAWRAGVPRRVGWARDGRGLLLTDGIRPAREVAPGVRQVLPRPFTTAAAELISSLGIAVRRTKPKLIPKTALCALLYERLEQKGLSQASPFVLVNAGGRPESAKALADWSAIVGSLLASGCPVVAVAGPGEEYRLEALERSLASSNASLGPKSWADLIRLDDPAASLSELAALGSLCRVALTTDGGPRHLFAASGAQQIVLFGPTDPRHTASHLDQTKSFVGNVTCGPCHKERCPLPTEFDRACFAAIDTDAVIRTALSYAPTETGSATTSPLPR